MPFHVIIGMKWMDPAYSFLPVLEVFLKRGEPLSKAPQVYRLFWKGLQLACGSPDYCIEDSDTCY